MVSTMVWTRIMSFELTGQGRDILQIRRVALSQHDSCRLFFISILLKGHNVAFLTWVRFCVVYWIVTG